MRHTLQAAFGLALVSLSGSEVLAAELPVTGSYRDTASCDAVRSLAGDDAAGAARASLSDTQRRVLSDAVQSGVTMEASRVAGPGGWVCSFPQVWPVGEGGRWLAMAACDAGGDFFPAVLTLEQLEAERYRLRLGDSADAVEMVPCTLATPETLDVAPAEAAPEAEESTDAQ